MKRKKLKGQMQDEDLEAYRKRYKLLNIERNTICALVRFLAMALQENLKRLVPMQ
jgi:hypothetical protein